MNENDDSTRPVTRAHLDARLDASEQRILDAIRAGNQEIETKVLTAFHGWARSHEIRVRGAVTLVSGFDERLSLLEERISRLERGDT